jgi:uncharacterized protein YndB with AHSA1/START domain
MTREPQFSPHPTADTIHWKLHFASSPMQVYRALATDQGRRGYWAESADETNGTIHYVFHDGLENTGAVLERVPGERFVVEYFHMRVRFDLADDGDGGTDMQMRCSMVPAEEKTEITAGWVSWLMAMKAWVDFGVDLRNHDPARSWFTGFVDN